MIAAALILAYHFVLYLAWFKPIAKAHNELAYDLHRLKEELEEANALTQKIIKFTNIQHLLDGRIDLGDGDAIHLDEDGIVKSEP
jgi:hypothetical protein